MHFECRAQNRGQISDILRDEKIVLHEAFDALEAAPTMIAQAFRQTRLTVEGQSFLRTIGQEMQMTPHGPQEILAATESHLLSAREDRLTDGIARVGAAARNITRKPVERVQVAQTAFPVLDVGLHQIARLAGSVMPGIAFGELGFDERCRRASHDLGRKAQLQRLEERPLTQDQTRVENGGPRRHVGERKLQALVDCPRRMTDFEIEIPKQHQNIFDDTFPPRGLLVRQHEQ